MAESLYIFGAGSYAQMMAAYFSATEKYKVEGYIVDPVYLKTNVAKDGLTIYDAMNLPRKLEPSKTLLFIALGYKDMRARASVYDRFTKLGFRFANYISPNAIICHNVFLGDNNAIFPGVVIEPYSKVGNNNIIWSNTTICHDSIIRNHCFLAANTTIGGFVSIEDLCFLGFSSTILQNVKLHNETLIGAGSVLTKDTKPFGKYLGSPAKFCSEHQAEGIML